MLPLPLPVLNNCGMSRVPLLVPVVADGVRIKITAWVDSRCWTPGRTTVAGVVLIYK